MRRAAYDHIRSELPMSVAASLLAEAAERIASAPAPRSRRPLPRPRRPRGLRARAAALVSRDPPVAVALNGTPAPVADGDDLLLTNPGDRLLPNGLERMRAALAADPDAGFAYGLVQLIGDRGPEGIANHFGRIHTPVLVRRGFEPSEIGSVRGAHVREFVASAQLSVPAEVKA
jgi:hypothetical protein